MKNSIWKQLLLSVILISGISHLANAQKYKLIPQKDAKTIYGLQLKEGWPKEMIKLKAKEFFIKGNTLRPSEKYTISKTTEGGYVIHSKDTQPEYTKQDDNKPVASGGGMTVYFVCEGCWPGDGCLVGSSNGQLYCTACSGGGCESRWLIAPTTKPVMEMQTPNGF